MQQIVQATDVSKIYEGIIVALSDCNFTLNRGITGFLGPNGAGKSTLIKLLVGELRPSIGEVTVLNENPWNNPQLNKKLGYISEVTGQFNFLTPLKQAIFLAKLAGFSRNEAKKRATEVLDLVGMTNFTNRNLTQLSKGMKQRVKIANAFLSYPEFIIADEPLSGLDPLGRNLIFDLFQDYAKDGGSVIVSSHILFEVERVTKDLILIYNGQIIAQGKTRSIRETLSEYPYKYEVITEKPLDLAKYLFDEYKSINGIALKYTNNDKYNMLNEDLTNNQLNRDNIKSLIITTVKPSSLYDSLYKINVETGIKIFSIQNLEEEAETESIFNYLINS
jgi:ABC-2 type transport system ATP-binding protein